MKEKYLVMNYLSFIGAVVILMGFLALKYFLEKKFGDGSDASLYKKKSRLMNDSELAFFVNLRRTLGEEYLVFPKVRVEDFVEVKEAGLMYGRKQGLRNRIKSNHVDFLICDRVTTAPLLSIELDGRSHRRADRMKRDVFVVELYKSVGLPFYRVKVGSDFYAETEAIGSILREKTGAVSVENNKTRPEISK